MSDLFQKSLRVYGYYPDLIAENKRLREALILVRDVVGESGAAVIIDAALAQEESERCGYRVHSDTGYSCDREKGHPGSHRFSYAQEESEWLERYHDGKKWTSRPIPQEKSE